MPTFDLDAIARETKRAQDEATPLTPFTSRHSDFDMPSAYQVAQLIHAARVAEGAAAVGRKIGFTNPDMWGLFGVREPVWAHVYDSTVVHASGPRIRCDIGRFLEPRIEPEVVIHFHAAPPIAGDVAEILASVDWIAHGIEIVQSHFPDWKFQAADTVADWAMHGTLLVGEPQDVRRLGPDLASQLEQFSVALSCDQVLHETGRGSNVLGSPLAAMSHLLGVIATQPRAATIQAGELVTTGTLTKAYPIKAGETWSTVFDGIALPGMSVAFEA